MIVPADRLDPNTLRMLIREFVSRDGTDYGESEASETSKIATVEAQLRSGEVVIVFDAESESCNLLTAREARKLGVL